MRTFVGFMVAADYYNVELCAWEPFVEPWRCRIGIHIPSFSPSTTSPTPRAHRPSLSSAFSPIPSTRRNSDASLQHASPPSTPQIPRLPDPFVDQTDLNTQNAVEIFVLSRVPLNINFTKPLVDACSTFVSLLKVTTHPLTEN